LDSTDFMNHHTLKVVRYSCYIFITSIKDEIVERFHGLQHGVPD
jgi:hypothetical protein